MTSRDALELLKAEDRKLVALKHAISVLEWDFETGSPEKASDERAEQMSLLSVMYHDEVVSDRFASIVDAIEDTEGFTDAECALVKKWKKDLREEKAVPSELVERISRIQAECHVKWLEAREKNDFSIFKGPLERMIEALKEQCLLIYPERAPYDTLLDIYEPGMTTADIDPLFDELEERIHEIMDRIGEKAAATDDSFLLEEYDEKALHGFCLDVMKRMGFDFSRGAVGISAHPFTTTLGRDDVRITTRYTDDSIFDPIGSVVHETGHALYEQNCALNPEIRGTSLSDGVSMGIHESQSRFWENFMGRSDAFWRFEYPILQERIPSLKNVDFDAFMKAANKSVPSAIRVNADELTYSLHIILRYRLEKKLFSGEIKVEDIPSEWNRMSQEIVRYTPKNDSEGCLQDCHWAGGSFGYFPTYALGNVYAAMFREALIEHLGGEEKLEEALSTGHFEEITSWQRDNIWYNGSVYEPKVLLKKATGKDLSLEPYVRYLSEKFYKIFG